MPKQSPVANDLDRPFWDACNEERLVVQRCTSCSRHQYPPEAKCRACGSASFDWDEVEGTGTIYSFGVIYDTPIALLQPEQPYNCAVVQLDADPEINFMSHLPGTPVDEVPIGAKVEITWETTPGNGQKVPEWRVVS